MSKKENYNEYMNEYMKRRHASRMARAREMLGGICVRCGASDNLEIDHIDPTTKSFTIGKFGSASEKRFLEEIKKCQLLCRSCHETKTLEDNGRTSAKNTHGTLSSRRYCDCSLCKKAIADYNREWKRKNKK